MLSAWIITVSRHKDMQNSILQTQIDSLVVVINKIHTNDKTVNIQEIIPVMKIDEIDTFQYLVLIHSVVFGITFLFIYMYIRCLKNIKTDNGEKKGCWLFKQRKKSN